MRITNVEALHLRLPQVQEVADGTQDCLLVQVHTDAGITGLGEVVSCSYVARAVIESPRSAPFRHGLAAIVEGMDADDIDGIRQAMIEGTNWYGPGGVTRHAMSGIDMALWDIRGKVQGLPVRHLLANTPVDTVPCYASVLWPPRPEEVATSAQSFLAQDYRAVKYGWAPMGPDARLDEELVAAARQALGPDIDLMVDAGRAWDIDTALERVARFQPYNIFWLEEALHPFDTAGHRQLCAHSAIPIAGGEALSLVEEYQALLEADGLDVVQPDLGRVGGLTGGRLIADLAAANQTWPVPHAFGTGVLLAASAQWAAASPRPLTEFTRAPSPLAQHLVRHDMVFDAGSLHLSQAPGLDVELDIAVVDRYRVA
ncbi:MAG: mandelate racemase/muconate lactonizing enzyme family protein [Candidatus Latescibacteria bacterium]|nr:mandelate racemase/muconate lactonizing enzyme family protein [Candidatus Latescibacterota bacterium]